MPTLYDPGSRTTQDHHAHPISQITPHLYIGTFHASTSIPLLLQNDITAIVSLLHSPQDEWSRPANRKLIPAKNHLFVKCDDSPEQDILSRLDEICDFIDKHTSPPNLKSRTDMILAMLGADGGGGGELKRGASIEDVEINGGKVLVHCSEGVSRSGAVVVGYLMKKEGKTLKEALKFVKRRRRVVQPRRSFLEQLKVWEKEGYKVWKEEEGGVRTPRDGYKRWLEKRENSVMV
ncbi:protein-tyrosine phosphatase-like protein [Cladorrhinum sp. PSN259]|nr:protein-tyrosine phosphatase-like protein [Cladorrhinum sp. PSN259]